MTRRLGAWDCSYCGHVKILGNVFDCPGCSRPRPRGVQFYEIPDGPIVTPEIQEQLGSGGPNWYCEHCDSGNKDINTKCWKCGAPKGSSPSHKIAHYKEGERPFSANDAARIDPVAYEAPKDPQSDDPWAGLVPSEVAAVGTGKSYPRSSVPVQIYPRANDEDVNQNLFSKLNFENYKNYVYGGIGLIMVVLLSILIYNVFFNTHNENVLVSGFSWTQNVRVEEYKVVHETSWTTHPSDAYHMQQSYRDTGRDRKVHDRWETEYYSDTCYRSETYSDTCTRSVYHSKSCTGSRSNGDGSFDTYTYECGSSSSESYSCTKTRQVPYTCQKSRQKEIYHYEDIWDNFYEYDVNRWVTVGNYPTSRNDHEPVFATVELKNSFTSGIPVLGQQRKFEEPGKYVVYFVCRNKKVGENGTFSREYPLVEWSKFMMEREYVIEVNVFNSILTFPTP